MRIKQLSAYLANQIAAGEVIERPASVLKELLENSLDAEAKHIEVEIEKGGLKYLRITDNGCGIYKDDLLLAVSPHATSKLHQPEDLFNIHTLGFRGEALASIGSIARLQLISCQEITGGAWQIIVEGQHIQPISPAAHPPGTTVIVQDLFFNTPARRKFLRSEKTEFSQLDEVFRRIVLSHYAVSFSLKHNQRQIYQLPAAESLLAQEKRITKLFGNNFLQHALRIEFAILGLKLWGWVVSPAYTRSQADQQYVYLNGRIIRDKLINHALRSAYEDKVYPGRYPLFLLYLEVEPSKVDVNVHPTKHEVRFHDSRLVHDFIYQSMREALMQPMTEADIPAYSEKQSYFTESSEFKQQQNFYEAATQANYQINERVSEYQPDEMAIGHGLMLSGDYLLIRQRAGIEIIDIRQAIAIAYKQYFAAAANTTMHSKPLLIPVAGSLAAKQMNQLEEVLEQLTAYGINLSILSMTQIALRTLPHFFDKLDKDKFLALLIESLCNKTMPASELSEQIAWAASQSVDLIQFDYQVLIAKLPSILEQARVERKKIHTLLTAADLHRLLQ